MADEEIIDFELDVDADASRLDTVLFEKLSTALEESEVEGSLEDLVLTRSKVSRWIESGYVQVNFQTVTKAGTKVKAGSIISVAVPPPRPLSLSPDASVPLDIVYEDRSVIVLNKRAGQVVHPGAGHWDKTIVNGLLAHLGQNILQVGDALRPGIVHRLDKDTSGLMVIAKSDQAYHNLVQQFVPPRQILREYIGITFWRPKKDRAEGVIDLPIGRHPTARMKMAIVSRGGRQAVTHWSIQKELRYGCELLLHLETGRTHQIRVHLKAIGAPLVGDKEYGSIPADVPIAVRHAVERFGRQALHAARLSFRHPQSGDQLEFTSDLPQDMQELITVLS